MSTSARFLRSKQRRASLWYAADGKCQRCGIPLPDGWHADHVIPWSVSQQTDVRQMQALCPSCNAIKGANMLRRHQREMQAVLEEFVSTRNGRMVLAWVTPGGGKSALPAIVTKVLVGKRVDRVCIVTPRRSLQRQMERSYLDKFMRSLINHDAEIRQSTNDYDPCRGKSGYVTTYQAIAADAEQVNVKEFDRHRYALILDEMHHLDDSGAWHKAIQPLVERAAIVILMTGTIERSDGKPIAYLPYKPGFDEWGNPGRVVDLDGGMPVIRYTRQDGLEEHAVIPLLFKHIDGNATWRDRDGQRKEGIPLSLAGKLTSDALYTALSTDYARQLLNESVNEWDAHRKQNPRAKLLAVAARIDKAKQYTAWLKAMGIRAEIATSDDSETAQANIDRFAKHGTADALDALVTVAMAYEGLDNPSITHIACLTHIRSRSWIEQMFGRGVRVDYEAGPYEKQSCWVYVPDDVLMSDIIALVNKEQGPFLEDRQKRELSGDREANDAKPLVPESSFVTRRRASDFSGGDVDYIETALLQKVIDDEGLIGLVHPIQLASAFRRYEQERQSGSFLTAMRAVESPAITAKERETQLRSEIEKYCRSWDYRTGSDKGSLNGIIFSHFGKVRKNMTEEELVRVWTWVNQQYPLSAANQGGADADKTTWTDAR